MEINAGEREMLCRLVQFQKARIWMLETVADILTVTSSVQPANAYVPILVTPSCSSALVMAA